MHLHTISTYRGYIVFRCSLWPSVRGSKVGGHIFPILFSSLLYNTSSISAFTFTIANTSTRATCRSLGSSDHRYSRTRTRLIVDRWRKLLLTAGTKMAGRWKEEHLDDREVASSIRHIHILDIRYLHVCLRSCDCSFILAGSDLSRKNPSFWQPDLKAPSFKVANFLGTLDHMIRWPYRFLSNLLCL